MSLFLLLTPNNLGPFYMDELNLGVLNLAVLDLNVLNLSVLNMTDIVPASEYNDPVRGIFYAEQSAGGVLSPLEVTGNGFVNQESVAWAIQKMGRVITFTCSSSAPITLGAPGNVITTQAGVVPEIFRTTASFRICTVPVTDNGDVVNGFIKFTSDGAITWGTSVVGGINLVGFTGVAGVFDCCVSYLR